MTPEQIAVVRQRLAELRLTIEAAFEKVKTENPFKTQGGMRDECDWQLLRDGKVIATGSTREEVK